MSKFFPKNLTKLQRSLKGGSASSVWLPLSLAFLSGTQIGHTNIAAVVGLLRKGAVRQAPAAFTQTGARRERGEAWERSRERFESARGNGGTNDVELFRVRDSVRRGEIDCDQVSRRKSSFVPEIRRQCAVYPSPARGDFTLVPLPWRSAYQAIAGSVGFP